MTTPPSLPNYAVAHSRSRPFAIAALIIAGIGVLPLIIYFFNCISQLGTRNSYYGDGNPLLVIAMGFIGFVIHAIGLICAVVALSIGGSQNCGNVGMIGNGAMLAAILLFGFIAIAGA